MAILPNNDVLFTLRNLCKHIKHSNMNRFYFSINISPQWISFPTSFSIILHSIWNWFLSKLTDCITVIYYGSSLVEIYKCNFLIHCMVSWEPLSLYNNSQELLGYFLREKLKDTDIQRERGRAGGQSVGRTLKELFMKKSAWKFTFIQDMTVLISIEQFQKF